MPPPNVADSVKGGLTLSCNGQLIFSVFVTENQRTPPGMLAG